MCYKDMTFCPFYEDCRDAIECTRPLTPKIRDDAKRWWGNENAPIAVFAEKPDCFRQKIEKEKE